MNDHPIYINENGRAVCADHIGHYARTFLQKRPNVTIFQTATDHWVRVDDDEIGCENCDAVTAPTLEPFVDDNADESELRDPRRRGVVRMNGAWMVSNVIV